MKTRYGKRLYFTALTTLMLTLAGCGGGGGGGEASGGSGNGGGTPQAKANSAPLVTNTRAVRSVAEGADVSFKIGYLFSDPDGDKLTYSALSMPAWLVLDSDTGEVTGSVPQDACAKTCRYSMQIGADDGRGGTAEANLTLRVTPVFKEAGWYGRTTVSATAKDGTVYSHTTAGVFGELKQSIDGKDKHDIPGFTAAILQILFIPNFPGDIETGYFSNYKHFAGAPADKQSWYFEVKIAKMEVTVGKEVDLTGQPFTLSLAQLKRVEYTNVEGRIRYREVPMGDDTLKTRLHLLDLDNDCTEHGPDDLAATPFVMEDANGTGVHTRRFRWVLGTPDGSDCAAPATRSRSLRSIAPADDFKPAPKRGGKFGLPPM